LEWDEVRAEVSNHIVGLSPVFLPHPVPIFDHDPCEYPFSDIFSPLTIGTTFTHYFNGSASKNPTMQLYSTYIGWLL